MRKFFILSIIISTIFLFNSCKEANNIDSQIISRENIQGRWLLISEQFHTKYSQGEETDTTIYFEDSELRINSTDTCEIYSNGFSYKLEMSYIEPDTLTFSSCPIGMMCDPIIYLITYKIIDFNRNEKMVLQNIKEYHDYTSESEDIIRTDTRTRYYLRN